jgi:hypothetical protein
VKALVVVPLKGVDPEAKLFAEVFAKKVDVFPEEYVEPGDVPEVEVLASPPFALASWRVPPPPPATSRLELSLPVPIRTKEAPPPPP